MKKILKWYEDLSLNQLVTLLIVTSIIFTLRILHAEHGWVTGDSVLYFEIARLFASGEWQQGYALFQWPLYPLLIAGVHKLTTLDIHHSAQLLCLLFFGITTFSFIQIIRLAGGCKTAISCGALLLLASQYIAGDVLPMLLRDQGFWAFYLSAIFFFIRFYKENLLKDALLWQVFMVLAMMFRIEAITFLALTPLILLWQPSRPIAQRFARLCKAHALNLSGLLLVFLIVAVSPIDFGDLGRLQEAFTVFQHVYLEVTQGLVAKADILGETVLGKYLEEHALMILIIGMVSIVVVKAIGTTGLVPLSLLAFNGKAGWEKMDPDVRTVILWIAALSVLNMTMIILRVYVLSGRYVVAFSFMLLVVAAFCLAQFFDESTRQPRLKRARQWLVGLLLLALFLGLAKNLAPKRAGYNYEQEAVTWVKQQGVSANAIFFDNNRIRFYAKAPYLPNHPDSWKYVVEAVEDGSIHHYEYVLIGFKDNLAETKRFLSGNLPQHRLDKIFYAPKRKKGVLVYRRT